MPIYEAECRKCGKKYEFYEPRITVDNRPCPDCGGIGDRLYSVYTAKIFTPFTTRNILPDGEPVTVSGPGQLRQLEAEHKVKMMDADARPPETSHPEAS